MKELQKNKKGFTLVELLAVIVILALIMSIAVVSMGGIMQSAREGTFKDTALSIIDGVKTQLSINGQLGNMGDSYYFFQEKLLEKGGTTSPISNTPISYIEDPTTKTVGGVSTLVVYRYKGTDKTETTVTRIGSSGIYKAVGTLNCGANGVNGYTGSTSNSYVKASYNATTKAFTYSICLTAGDGNPYIDATEADLLNTASNTNAIKGI